MIVARSVDGWMRLARRWRVPAPVMPADGEARARSKAPVRRRMADAESCAVPSCTARVRFGLWQCQPAALAQQLWGNNAVTALIGGPWSEAQAAQRLALGRHQRLPQVGRSLTRWSPQCCRLRQRHAETLVRRGSVASGIEAKHRPEDPTVMRTTAL